MYFQKVLVTKDSLPQLTNVEEFVYQSNTDKYTEGWEGNVCFSRHYPGTPGILLSPQKRTPAFTRDHWLELGWKNTASNEPQQGVH